MEELKVVEQGTEEKRVWKAINSNDVVAAPENVNLEAEIAEAEKICWELSKAYVGLIKIFNREVTRMSNTDRLELLEEAETLLAEYEGQAELYELLTGDSRRVPS